MRRPISITSLCAVAALSVAFATGCGGDSDRRATQTPAAVTPGVPRAESGSTPSSTPLASGGGSRPESPSTQARALVIGSYPIADWQVALAATWGHEPALLWTARRVTDTRWIGRLKITAPGHRLTASWAINAPLGPDPTAAQIDEALRDDTLPEPLDAGARKLSEQPPTG